jgi:hypothetical protein
MRKDGTIPHGTAGGYTNHKCKCDDCREAWRISHLAYMHRHPEQQERHRNYMRARRLVSA